MDLEWRAWRFWRADAAVAELLRGPQRTGEKIDGRSDIFSLGVILYGLLTGRKPFTWETLSSVMMAILRTEPAQPSTAAADVHPPWNAILAKALAKTGTSRYQTVREFAQAVRDAPAR